jgi:ABC-type branched-subunit amino acid transport system substrate-binding protein/outer membrane protein assembly factor BamD (BamD/ComL family)
MLDHTSDRGGKTMRRNVSTSGLIFMLALTIFAGCTVIQTPKTVETAPSPADTHSRQAAQELALAEEAFRQGNLEAAREQYASLVKAYAETAEATRAMLRLGEIEFQGERYAQAISRFQEAVNRAPMTPDGREARLWLLRCYMKMGRFNDAAESGRPLMSFLPEKSQRAEVAELVGDANAGLGRHAEAVRWYARSYPLASSGRAAELANKAGTQVKSLNRESVVALLTEFPDVFPYFFLQTRLAELDMGSGQLDAAQRRLEGLLARAPTDPLGETWMAMTSRIRELRDVDMQAVGCVLPLSGRYKGYGDRVLRGMGMAAQGSGTSENGVRLVVKDSGGDPATAAAAVRELAMTHKVAAIIGPLSRQAAEAAASEAQQLQIPIITLTQKREITQVGDYVFRDSLSNEQQVRALAEYALLGLGLRRFAILYPQDAYGGRLMQLFGYEVSRLGGEVRGREAYSTSETDFAYQIKKLLGLSSSGQKTGPAEVGLPGEDTEGPDEQQELGSIPQSGIAVDFEAMFIPDGYDKVGLIAPQLVYYSLTGIRLLGINLWNSPKLLEMAAPYVEGAVFVDGFFPDSERPMTRQFVQSYQETFGEIPGYPEAQGYDVMRLVMATLEERGVTTRPRLREALLAVRDFPGVEGLATMTPAREVERQPFFITVQKRRMVEVPVDLKSLEKRRPMMREPVLPGAPQGLPPEPDAPLGKPQP